MSFLDKNGLQVLTTKLVQGDAIKVASHRGHTVKNVIDNITRECENIATPNTMTLENRVSEFKVGKGRDVDVSGDVEEGKIEVGLIHPASCGHGINLQKGSSHIVFFGQTWSLELYQQTVARLWRQGQKSKTVVVQHIITAGTIDEDIMKALANKDMTQNRLIAAVKARVTHGR